ncbi:uncharacterized protein LOC105691000 [Athalia rosae]|uniref:uncharacterized protein LOC105691000 n=1 Tax=Athalia rosae TaxID=37344 RepID=UPI0020349CF8|nr:uncharacterized protein LOC105691000 [Athalia rosae]
MPLMHDNASGKGSIDGSRPPTQNPSAGDLDVPEPPQGPSTRSSSPTILSGELFLRVHAQNEIIESMEKLLTQASEPADDVILTEVTVMLDQLEELHQAFRTEHSWLVSHWPPAHLDHAYFARKVSSTETRLMLKTKRLLGRLQEQLTAPAQSADSSGTGSRPRPRLPELTVPTSSGDYRKWPEFKAMFLSVIENRSDVTDLEKFQYLKGAIQGDASELIANLSPHPASYNAAWLLLDARFENKRLIIKTHLDRLLALKPMPKRQASSLTKMVSIINETTQSLRTLTSESNNDCLLVALISGLLDRDTRERWETSLTSTDEFPTLSQLTAFLMARARTLGKIDETPTPVQSSAAKGALPKRASPHQASQQPQDRSSPAPTKTTQQTTQRRSLYPFDCCGQDHFIVMCPKLRDYSLTQRVKLVKERRLCCNCLGRHNARKCNSSRHCKTCNDTHHTMLHGADLSSMFNTPTERTQSSQDAQKEPTSDVKSWTPSHPAGNSHHHSLLNDLITSGSSPHRSWLRSFVYLGKAHQTAQPLAKGVVTLTLHSRYRPLSVNISAHVLKTVTTIMPTSAISQELEWPHLKRLNLADPEFLTPRAIDVIIGADFYEQLIKPNIIRHSPETPIAQLPIFGWLVIGPVHTPVTIVRTTHHGVSQASNSSLQELLTRFWVQEEPPSSSDSRLTPEEQECERHFSTTHSRDSTGRYIVRIPLKMSSAALGDSQHTAHQCLLRILKRLGRDAQYCELYTQFMQEYERAKHMIKLDDSSASRRPHYYLPHHGVLKPDSSTTKLRVVSNGSSASSTGYSVNDLMHAGPNLMLNIFDLLIRIRRHEQEEESHYHLTTVTYGTKVAPFSAVRTLLQLAEDEGSRYPLAVEPITHGRYVDDIFGGSDTVDELTQTARQLIQLCHAGGFPLAIWHSTSRQLLEEVSSELGHTSDISFDDCNAKILGIRWSLQQDTFNFSTISSTHSARFSKRLILSEVAQLFDPLGFTAPVVIRAKMFLQALWLHKLNWDDPLPEQLITQWLSIRQDLTSLARLSIPRWFNTLSDSAVELHGFSDASQFAIAAVVYLVAHSPSTGANVSLICSRTKVSPLKRLTIPRLELTAALLLSTLMNHVSATLNINITNTHSWTDFQVTLTWIKAHPSRWKDYVHQLEEHSLWWTGPPWMTQPEASWPTQADLAPDDTCAQEARATVTLHAVRTSPEYHWDLIRKFSSLNTLLRITSLCSNLIKKLSRKRNSPAASISSNDMEDSRLFWIKATQSAYFQEELAQLNWHSQLPNSHPLSRLTAFIDKDGVLRVGGRLKKSELSYETKHPAILPRTSRLSKLIIAHAHKQTMHGGTQTTLALIRQLHWIIGGRAPVKSYVLRCVVCARQRGIRAQQLMGQLPRAQVTPSRPSSHTGIDYAGPLTIKTWRGRGSRTHKRWICVFVYLTTSATHLEVVPDYTTEGFIATYRRFTSRRGIPSTLYPDCGTNFLGAEAQLKQCFAESSSGHQKIASLLSQDKTQWLFNPPAAPHMGGKWKVVVRSLKFHIKRTVGDTLLTYEETATLLTQIEAILNSRPLEPVSDDPEDTQVLIPGHFLIGTALNAVPEPSLLDVSTNRLSRWQFIQQRMQQFWHTWSTQYLQRLQAISKWHHPHNNIQVGSLVLITDERLPPGKWLMARVLKLLPGDDGLTRVVSLRTATTTLTRPIPKLAKLPVTQPQKAQLIINKMLMAGENV